MSHDFAAQKAQTGAVYAALVEEHGTLPDVADVDYFFVPTSDEADWRPLADMLTRQGFECQYFEADEGPASEPAAEEEADEDEAPYLVATLLDQALSVEGIWIGEETATKIAIEHGFKADGWGFEG